MVKNECYVRVLRLCKRSAEGGIKGAGESMLAQAEWQVVVELVAAVLGLAAARRRRRRHGLFVVSI